jgi:hypothetical protein
VHPSKPGKLVSRVGSVVVIPLIVVIALILGIPGPVRAAQLKTPPQPGDLRPTLVFPQFVSGQPLHLVAYGDTRFTDPAVTGVTNPRVRKWLAERIGQRHPQAILLTGDTPFNGANPADWQVFQSETKSWRAENAIELPTTGNHEVMGGGPAGIANYLNNFPEIAGHRYYSALMGSAEVISLDYTSPSGASTVQGRWFAAQLDHVPAQVEFLVILYHLPWMADRQSEVFANLPTKDCLILRGMLESRLPRIHAKVIVINGHIHNYERFERQGVEYVITGGGGAKPYPLLFRGEGDLYRDIAFPVYHYLTIDIENHQLHAVMWKVKDTEAQTLEDEVKDEFTIAASLGRASQAQRPPRPKAHTSHD